MNFNKGDRVTWTYKHTLNRKSSTYITKEGTFITRCKPNANKGLANMMWNTDFAIVHFDGNKNPSKVLIIELQAKVST